MRGPRESAFGLFELGAARLALLYLVLGAGWVIVSGRLPGPGQGTDLVLFHTLREMFFVAATSVLLYLLVIHQNRKLTDMNRSITASEARLRQLLDSAPVGIFVTRGTLFDYANNASAQFLGFPSERDLTGRGLADRLNASSRDFLNAAIVTALAERKAVGPLRLVMVRSDGTEVESELMLHHVLHEGEDAVQAAMTDATERRQLTEELREARRLEALGRSAAGVAHDFGTLLTLILGYASLAKSKLPRDHAATKALGEVEAAGRQASELTEGILSYCRGQSQEKSALPVIAIVSDAIRMLRGLAPGSVQIRQDLDAAEDVWIRSDPSQLRRAAINLGNNAIEAMNGNGTLTMRLTEPYIEERSGGLPPRLVVRLELTDTGPGMSEETMARIFEPFFTTRRRGGGNGLGLAIARDIVTDHGGRIRVTSEVGRGSTFAIVLPVVAEPTPDEPEVDLTEPKAANVEQDQPLVLIAEDDSQVRNVLSLSLRIAGFSVVDTNDGRELLDAYRANAGRVSLLIVDLDLPMMSGLECLKKIRERDRAIPVIIITGGSGEEVEELDERSVVLRKPVDMSDLIGVVRERIGEKA